MPISPQKYISYTNKFLLGHIFFYRLNQDIDNQNNIDEEISDIFLKEQEGISQNKNISKLIFLINNILSILTGTNIVYSKESFITKIKNFFFLKENEKRDNHNSSSNNKPSSEEIDNSNDETESFTDFINDPIKSLIKKKDELISFSKEIFDLNQQFFKDIKSNSFNIHNLDLQKYDYSSNNYHTIEVESINDKEYLFFEYRSYPNVIFLTKKKNFCEQLKNFNISDPNLIKNLELRNLEVFFIYSQKKELSNLLTKDNINRIIDFIYNILDKLPNSNILNTLIHTFEEYGNIEDLDNFKSLIEEKIEECIPEKQKKQENTDDKQNSFQKIISKSFNVFGNYTGINPIDIVDKLNDIVDKLKRLMTGLKNIFQLLNSIKPTINCISNLIYESYKAAEAVPESQAESGQVFSSSENQFYHYFMSIKEKKRNTLYYLCYTYLYCLKNISDSNFYEHLKSSILMILNEEIPIPKTKLNGKDIIAIYIISFFNIINSSKLDNEVIKYKMNFQLDIINPSSIPSGEAIKKILTTMKNDLEKVSKSSVLYDSTIKDVCQEHGYNFICKFIPTLFFETITKKYYDYIYSNEYYVRVFFVILNTKINEFREINSILSNDHEISEEIETSEISTHADSFIETKENKIIELIGDNSYNQEYKDLFNKIKAPFMELDSIVGLIYDILYQHYFSDNNFNNNYNKIKDLIKNNLHKLSKNLVSNDQFSLILKLFISNYLLIDKKILKLIIEHFQDKKSAPSDQNTPSFSISSENESNLVTYNRFFKSNYQIINNHFEKIENLLVNDRSRSPNKNMCIRIINLFLHIIELYNKELYTKICNIFPKQEYDSQPFKTLTISYNSVSEDIIKLLIKDNSQLKSFFIALLNNNVSDILELSNYLDYLINNYFSIFNIIIRKVDISNYLSELRLPNILVIDYYLVSYLLDNNLVLCTINSSQKDTFQHLFSSTDYWILKENNRIYKKNLFLKAYDLSLIIIPFNLISFINNYNFKDKYKLFDIFEKVYKLEDYNSTESFRENICYKHVKGNLNTYIKSLKNKISLLIDNNSKNFKDIQKELEILVNIRFELITNQIDIYFENVTRLYFVSNHQKKTSKDIDEKLKKKIRNCKLVIDILFQKVEKIIFKINQYLNNNTPSIPSDQISSIINLFEIFQFNTFYTTALGANLYDKEYNIYSLLSNIIEKKELSDIDFLNNFQPVGIKNISFNDPIKLIIHSFLKEFLKLLYIKESKSSSSPASDSTNTNLINHIHRLYNSFLRLNKSTKKEKVGEGINFINKFNIFNYNQDIIKLRTDKFKLVSLYKICYFLQINYKVDINRYLNDPLIGGNIKKIKNVYSRKILRNKKIKSTRKKIS